MVKVSLPTLHALIYLLKAKLTHFLLEQNHLIHTSATEPFLFTFDFWISLFFYKLQDGLKMSSKPVTLIVKFEFEFNAIESLKSRLNVKIEICQIEGTIFYNHDRKNRILTYIRKLEHSLQECCS